MRAALLLIWIVLNAVTVYAQQTPVSYSAGNHTITIDWEKSVTIRNDSLNKVILEGKWLKTLYPELPKIITDPEDFKKMFRGQSGTLPVMEMHLVAILKTGTPGEMVSLNMFIETIDVTVTGRDKTIAYTMRPAFNNFEIQEN